MMMIRRRGIGNLHRREISGRTQRRADTAVLSIRKVQASKGGTAGVVVEAGGCEERSRGDRSDGWGQGASLGEAAGGKAGPPAADGRREGCHGGQERGLSCISVRTFHAVLTYELVLCRGSDRRCHADVPMIERCKKIWIAMGYESNGLVVESSRASRVMSPSPHADFPHCRCQP